MEIREIQEKLADSGLKITPQRIYVYEAIMNLNNHPTAEMVKKYVEKNYPSISLGTIYKTLETLVDKGLINKIKTEADVMRYDPVLKKHHHIFCQKTNTIADYHDDELMQLLHDYFNQHNIPGFTIEDFKLHIIGEFEDK